MLREHGANPIWLGSAYYSERHVLFSSYNIIWRCAGGTAGETETIGVNVEIRRDIGLSHFCKADAEGHRWFRDERETGVSVTPSRCDLRCFLAGNRLSVPNL